MTIVLRSSSRAVAGPVMAYEDDPEKFVLDCFRRAPGKGPSDYQRELLRAIAEHSRISVQVESKVDIRKRLGWSTDTGDAVVQAFWREPEAVEPVFRIDRIKRAESPLATFGGRPYVIV